MIGDIVELSNLQVHEFCLLNLETGERKFSRTNQLYPGVFTGLFFRDKDTFFASYPTKLGPFIYYKEKSYPINKELAITLDKIGKDRIFKISEYGIEIRYKKFEYINFDAWSTEMDVDLFYAISEEYREDSFYKSYTK